MAKGSGIKSGERTTADSYGPNFLRIQFGREAIPKKGDILALEPQQVEELSIVLDINKFLPSFRMKIMDSAGFFTHLTPFDRDLARMHVQIGKSIAGGVENTTSFSFDVYRRFPRSDFVYDFEGLLIADNLLTPRKTRGFSGTVESALEIISDEVGADSSEISGSLDYEKSLVQANWTNAKFLTYLKDNVIGNSGESSFFCFVKCKETSKIFVFKSLYDFVHTTPKYNFCLCDFVWEDRESGTVYYPILEYRIEDNYKYIGTICGRRQETIYFDYANSQLKFDSIDVSGNSNGLLDYPSLTQFFLIDNADDPKDNIALLDTGRSNDFTSNFRGKALNSFHRDITNLSKIWIDTLGIEDIYPGDIVTIYFIEHEFTGEKFGYEHQGFWMVERVEHLIGKGYITRLLLARNGTDSAVTHNLLQATNWKTA